MSFKRSFQGTKSTTFLKSAQTNCHDYKGYHIGVFYAISIYSVMFEAQDDKKTK